MIIAIDGPAGSGKSTTARLVADRLGYGYLDTGAMYRAVALHFLRRGLAGDALAAEAAAREMAGVHIDTRFEAEGMRTLLNGEDVSEVIRTPEVTRLASAVSALPCVRGRLVEAQRRIAAEAVEAGGGVVLDGRDIGTYVFPQADVKVFMVAAPEMRAARRCAELRQRGIPAEPEAVLREMLRRDEQDASRSLAPLAAAEDALVVDTTAQTVEQQVNLVLEVVKERKGYAPV